MKKILILIVCLAMLLSITAYAQPDKEDVINVFSLEQIATRMVQLISMEAEDYGLSSVSFDNVYLSNPVRPYSVREDKSFVVDETIEYYPVCANGEVIAILTVLSDENGNSTTLLNTEFAKELNEFIGNDKNTKFAIIHDSGSLYILGKDEIKLAKDINPSSGMKVLKSSKVKAEELDTDSIVIGSMSEYLVLDVPQVTILRTQMYNKLDLPHKSQTYDLCWAANVASVGQYKTGINKTAQQVADLQGIPYIGGASMQDVEDALDDIYNISSTDCSYSLNLTDVCYEIDDDKPVIAAFLSLNGSYGHGVVICGYAHSVSSGSIYYLRDPYYTSNTLAHPATVSGTLTLMVNYYSVDLYWHSTCYLN